MICCLSSIRQTPRGEMPEHNCFEPVVSWVRACEATGGIEKALAVALAFFASLILCVSVVGSPLFLMAYEEYVLQEVEPRFAAVQTAATRALAQQVEEQASEIRRLEDEVRKKPDPDDGNIMEFSSITPITLPKTPRGSVQPSKDQQIEILQAQVKVLKLENEKLVVQSLAFEPVRGAPLTKSATMLPMRQSLS